MAGGVRLAAILKETSVGFITITKDMAAPARGQPSPTALEMNLDSYLLRKNIFLHHFAPIPFSSLRKLHILDPKMC